MTSAIFDDMIAGTGTPESTDVTAETAETNASEWPKTVTLPAGEAPEGAVPVAEFSKIVNEKVVKDRVTELLNDGLAPADAVVQALAAQVNQASFYQAVKGQRNAMPHYKVQYEVSVLDDEGAETGEVKNEEKIFVPVDVALAWWENRPTRGGGGAARSDEDVAKRLIKAGKKAADLEAARERHAKLTANIERMTVQLNRYVELLEADGKNLDDAKAAHEAEAEKDEAEKAIADNE